MAQWVSTSWGAMTDVPPTSKLISIYLTTGISGIRVKELKTTWNTWSRKISSPYIFVVYLFPEKQELNESPFFQSLLFRFLFLISFWRFSSSWSAAYAPFYNPTSTVGDCCLIPSKGWIYTSTFVCIKMSTICAYTETTTTQKMTAPQCGCTGNCRTGQPRYRRKLLVTSNSAFSEQNTRSQQHNDADLTLLP